MVAEGGDIAADFVDVAEAEDEDGVDRVGGEFVETDEGDAGFGGDEAWAFGFFVDEVFEFGGAAHGGERHDPAAASTVAGEGFAVGGHLVDEAVEVLDGAGDVGTDEGVVVEVVEGVRRGRLDGSGGRSR